MAMFTIAVRYAAFKNKAVPASSLHLSKITTIRRSPGTAARPIAPRTSAARCQPLARGHLQCYQCMSRRAAPRPAVIRASIRPSTYFTVSFLLCSMAAFRELTSLSICSKGAGQQGHRQGGKPRLAGGQRGEVTRLL